MPGLHEYHGKKWNLLLPLLNNIFNNKNASFDLNKMTKCSQAAWIGAKQGPTVNFSIGF